MFQHITIAVILSISMPLYANVNDTDKCQLISDATRQEENIINVIKIDTEQKFIYSVTNYTSTDCQKFIKKFSVQNPDLLHYKGSLWGILSAGEIEAGLCALKTELCLTPTNCKTVIIKLKHNQNGEYVAAFPNCIELNFK